MPIRSVHLFSERDHPPCYKNTSAFIIGLMTLRKLHFEFKKINKGRSVDKTLWCRIWTGQIEILLCGHGDFSEIQKIWIRLWNTLPRKYGPYD